METETDWLTAMKEPSSKCLQHIPVQTPRTLLSSIKRPYTKIIFCISYHSVDTHLFATFSGDLRTMFDHVIWFTRMWYRFTDYSFCRFMKTSSWFILTDALHVLWDVYLCTNKSLFLAHVDSHRYYFKHWLLPLSYPQNNIEQILYENHVNLVISGHVHAYERSFPVFNSSIRTDGTTYITIGDAGNHEGELR